MQVSDLLAEGMQVAAVGARTQERADAFAARFGIENRHASYEALVGDPSVDIVYVATPHPMHCENALLAVEAGKHVLIEKAISFANRIFGTPAWSSCSVPRLGLPALLNPVNVVPFCLPREVGRERCG